jgi:hypothetical protein
MGYHTDFSGNVDITPPLSAEMVEYINKFSNTRRMARDVTKLQELFKGEGGFFGDYGKDGEYFVGGGGYHGQGKDDSIIGYNGSPKTQPGLWCQWEVSEDGTTLEWDGGEKFYAYIEWLEYLIKNFFEPKGHTLNGQIEWYGEERGDVGTIYVRDNKVQTEPFKEPKKTSKQVPITHKVSGTPINK